LTVEVVILILNLNVARNGTTTYYIPIYTRTVLGNYNDNDLHFDRLVFDDSFYLDPRP